MKLIYSVEIISATRVDGFHQGGPGFEDLDALTFKELEDVILHSLLGEMYSSGSIDLEYSLVDISSALHMLSKKGFLIMKGGLRLIVDTEGGVDYLFEWRGPLHHLVDLDEGVVDWFTSISNCMS